MSPPTTRRYRATPGTRRRQPRVRRASAALTPVRAGALIAMLASAGAIYGLAATPAFGFDRLTITGNVLTPSDAIADRVAIEHGTNLVGLTTQPIADRLRDLPPVGDVAVRVGLPDTLSVEVTERTPVVLWQVADRRFAVDAGGFVFAEVPADAPDAVKTIPTVVDERASAAGLGIRSVLDRVDIDAATRLASLRPETIGSHAPALNVVVNDANGFTVSSGANGWTAVFGKYGLSQRTTNMIPGEVQLLTALLAGREDTIETVFLSDERNGTYLPKPSPRATARPSATP